MSELDSSTIRSWMLQQNISENIHGTANCLLKLQEQPQSVACNLTIAGEHYWSDSTGAEPSPEVRLKIVPSSQNPRFELSMKIPARRKEGSGEGGSGDGERVILAVFLASDAKSPEKHGSRNPEAYSGRLNLNVASPPDGGKDGITFSDQLRWVQFRRQTDKNGDEVKGALPGLSHRDPGQAKPQANQLWVSWRFTDYVLIGGDLDTTGLSESQRAGVETFKRMLRRGQKEDRTLHAITKNAPHMTFATWPYFASIPSPVPSSFSLWLQPVGAEDIIVFPPNKSFERSEDLANQLLGNLGKEWYKAGTAAGQLVAELIKKKQFALAKLAPTSYFTDARHYLAVVLGCYGYENLHASQTANRYYDGEHKCDILFSDNSKKYLFLMNIRPPRTTDQDRAEDLPLPAVNERVTAYYTKSNTQYTLRGRVIAIPTDCKKYGRNVAVMAKPLPTTPQAGYITSGWTQQIVSFTFGPSGGATSPTVDRIVALMTDQLPTKGPVDPAWLKKVLLGHANTSMDTQAVHPDLPKDFTATVNRICAERKLNAEQTEVVHHYFTHKLTIVRGPPGTGKSTLIDTIVQIEEVLKTRFWICTDSNTACDVLVRKAAKRRGSTQPDGLLRVRTAAEETVDFSDQNLPILLSGPAITSGDTIEDAIARAFEDYGDVEKVMSLEGLIQRRNGMLSDIESDPTKQMYSDEKGNNEALHLSNLRQACKDFNALRFQESKEEDFIEQQQRLEKRFHRAVQTLQQQYVKVTKGIFSTAAAGNGQLLRFVAPNAVIMDEASQLMEARAVSPLVHAMRAGNLCRILLIGDDKQLPPTVLAPRNPFSDYGAISLFERLIRSGYKVITLRKQYRMHPSISLVCKEAIYADIGGIADGEGVDKQPNVGLLQQWLTTLCQRNGRKRDFPKDTNAINIIPVADKPDFPLATARIPHSTSRFNLNTARLTLRLVEDLLDRFKADQIMVIAFYKDQVQLLQALFQAIDSTKDKIVVQTVDGSQGSEREIVIVDTVTMGPAGGDSLGFINSDRRRFNVAMSRAQVGRIVIAHKDIQKGARDKEAGKTMGPWTHFFNKAEPLEARSLNKLNSPAFRTALNGVLGGWQSKLKEDAIAHKNYIAPGKPLLVGTQKAMIKERTLSSIFVAHTGATEIEALAYLRKASFDLSAAINAYFHEHPGEIDEVEEVKR